MILNTLAVILCIYWIGGFLAVLISLLLTAKAQDHKSVMDFIRLLLRTRETFIRIWLLSFFGLPHIFSAYKARKVKVVSSRPVKTYKNPYGKRFY